MADPKTIADVLDKSIDKLSGGVAEVAKAVKQMAPHAWEVAVRQQVVEGWASLALAGLLALGLLACFLAGWLTRKRWYADMDEAGATPALMFLIFPFILLLMAVDSGRDAALKIANPEYYAAMAILQAAK